MALSSVLPVYATTFLLLSFSGFGNGGLSEPCSEMSTCTATVTFSICRKNPVDDCNGMGMCACDIGYVPYFGEDGEDDLCLSKAVWIGQSCLKDVQCVSLGGPEATHCDQRTGTCECSEGYTAHGFSCMVKSNLGDECVENIQCSTQVENSVCEETVDKVLKRCQCVATHYQPDSGSDRNTCFMGALRPGDSCEGHPVQCRGLGNGSCNRSTNTCQCADNHVWVEAVGKCLKKVEHLNGERCERNEQCQVQHAYCIDNVCSCDGVLQAANPNSEECLEGAIELDKSPCKHTVQCQINLGDGSACIDGICRCDAGAILASSEDGEKCFVPVPLGGACNYTDQCMDKSGARNLIICEENVCVCADHVSVAIDGVCYHKRTLGDEANCGSTLECKANIEGPAVCKVGGDGNNRCTCDIGYVANSNGTKCLLGNLQYGEYCEADSQCRSDLECWDYVYSPICTCPLDDGSGNTGRFDYETDQCEKHSSGAINESIAGNLLSALIILYFVGNLIK